MADDEAASAPMPPPPPDADDAPTDDDSAPTATSLERRATAAFRKGRLGRARDLYTAALELEGGTAEDAAAKWLALSNRAACLLRLERPREAEADCREALKQRAPANLLALCAVACMRQPGEAHLMAAFACCVEALYVEPQNAAARRVLADVRKAPGGRLLRPETAARERLESRMLRRGESGRIGYALAYFDALERLAPEDAVVHLRVQSCWRSALTGRIPEPIQAVPTGAPASLD